ncbi:DNA utilization protein GntX [Planctomycetes bacterium MalM25]|nr:DNA utilization protein GntX [Planctomycetes bacterium MalM25]
MPDLRQHAGAVYAALLDVAFPPGCVACAAGTADAPADRRDFCEGCWDDLPRFNEPVCTRCSTPLAAADRDDPDCPACRREVWAFDATIALGAYDGLLRRLVLATKRRAGEPIAEALGRGLARQVAAITPDDALIAPIPQHWRRRLLRRADGVAALAGALAERSGRPLARPLVRHRATPRQTRIAPSGRAANVRGAFSVPRPERVAGRTILLVDDVLTTGATCHAAAMALQKAGAERVVAVVAARRLGGL